ncbi:MAG: tetratricopeptide repeat protein [Ruminococcaceae bacterium]|nr:tetratricopeptide repeat protein [Oscillospiraceae bacterium]
MKWIIILLLILGLLWYLLPTVLTVLGNRAYHDKSLREALKWYQRAYKTGRMSPMTKMAYGLLILRDGRPEDAERLLSAVISDRKIKPEKKAPARAYRAMAYVKQGKIEDAYEEMQELLETNKSSLTYSLAGYIMALTDCPAEQLLAFCEEAYDYNADERDIADNLAVACLKCGDAARAAELCEDLMEDYPDFTEGYYHAAQAYAALGDFPKAKQCLDKIADCRRSYMTTVSEDEISGLAERIHAAL